MIAFVPRDTVALAMGADAVADALAAAGASVTRNGSRGLCWLEPLLEIDTGDGRIALGPINAQDVPSLREAMQNDISLHPKYLGDIETHPYLAKQQRLTFSRAGLGEPLCLEHYQSLDGFKALRTAIELSPIWLSRK